MFNVATDPAWCYCIFHLIHSRTMKLKKKRRKRRLKDDSASAGNIRRRSFIWTEDWTSWKILQVTFLCGCSTRWHIWVNIRKAWLPSAWTKTLLCECLLQCVPCNLYFWMPVYFVFVRRGNDLTRFSEDTAIPGISLHALMATIGWCSHYHYYFFHYYHYWHALGVLIW